MKTDCSVHLLFDQQAKRLATTTDELSVERKSIDEAVAVKLKHFEKLIKSRAQFLDIGVATGDVDKALEDAQREVDALGAKAADVAQRLEGIGKELAAMEPSMWLIKMARELWEMKSVPRSASLQELYREAKVNVLREGAVATKVAIQFFTGHHKPEVSFEIKIRSVTARYLSLAVPDTLHWLPSGATGIAATNQSRYSSNDGTEWVTLSPEDSGQIPRLCYLESEGRLLPALPDVKWRVKNPNFGPQCRQEPNEWIDHSRNMEVDLPSFSQLITHELGDAKELDLDVEYGPGTLLGFVRDLVLQATVTPEDYQFKSSPEESLSEEILKRLQPHWASFVTGPWRKEMTGLLANLKYYCENGEKPRFFSLEYQNSFGFRLRTRDHSWIVGQVYLMPEGRQQLAENSIAFEICRKGYGDEIVFSVGPLFVRIQGQEHLTR